MLAFQTMMSAENWNETTKKNVAISLAPVQKRPTASLVHMYTFSTYKYIWVDLNQKYWEKINEKYTNCSVLLKNT